jgi:hypothetical protein
MQKQLFSCIVLVTIALAFVFVTGCGKDDTPVVKTKTQLITQSTWKFKNATANGTDISNQSPPFDPCKKDNIITFSTSGSGNINEGATKCNSTDPDNVSFTWNFASSETILHISTTLFTGGSNDFTLVSLTETELVVSQGYTPPVGPSLLIVITFQH